MAMFLQLLKKRNHFHRYFRFGSWYSISWFFEENIQNLIKEVKAAGNIILFFDEIHQILGAGSTGDGQGSKGLADILKPALSRGEMTVIGATTQDEYRNTIMKNAALARRFNEVKVNAPSPEDTFKILQGIRPLYEAHP